MSLLVTSSQRQAKHLSPRPRAPVAASGREPPAVSPPRSSASRSAASRACASSSPKPSPSAASAPATAPEISACSGAECPATAPAAPIPAGGSSGMWVPLCGVPMRLRPRLEQQRGRRDAAPGDRDQVAVEAALGVGDQSPFAVELGDHRGLHLPPPDRAGDRAALQVGDSGLPQPRSERLLRSARAGVGDCGDLDPRSMQGKRRVQAAVRGGGDHRGPSGRHRVEARESLGAGAEHHPGEVVALEHQRLLDRAGGGDVALGANLVQGAPAPDGDDPVEEAERRGRRQDLDLGLAQALAQPGDGVAVGSGEQAAAELGAVVDQDDVGSQLARPQRRRHPGHAAADHQHVGVTAAVLGAPLALRLAAAQPAEAGGVAQHLLVERPEAPRPDEGLVVEAGRGDPAAEDVGGPHRVKPQGWSGVHVRDLHPVAHRLGAGPDPGPAVDLDQAVRALPGAAEQAAGAVVLEAARDHPLPRGVKRGADRVALERLHGAAVEAELDLPPAVDPLSRLPRKPAHRSLPPGSPTQLTSLVVVSRSARNHSRQPER